MPKHGPRFWVEIAILGLLLVFGMASLTAWLPSPWVNILRVLWAAVLFGTYAIHYERYWGRRK